MNLKKNCHVKWKIIIDLSKKKKRCGIRILFIIKKTKNKTKQIKTRKHKKNL